MPGWLTRCHADVPRGDAWLGAGERRALARLSVRRRRRDWLLGRWAAKSAVGAWLSVEPERVEILAAPDGAPEAWVDGERAPTSVSISHRAGRALAVVGAPGEVIGCDLERIEPRSGAFVREWLAPPEQGLLAAHREDERPQVANLVWTAKEAGAKVRRQGLRLDVRHAVVASGEAGAADGAWRELRIEWPDVAATTSGWWRAHDGWIMTIAGEPSPSRPQQIEGATAEGISRA